LRLGGFFTAFRICRRFRYICQDFVQILVIHNGKFSVILPVDMIK
jgi:hypothetical protein